MKKYLKFIIPALFALAVLLGLLQRNNNQYTFSKIPTSGSLLSYYQKGQNLKQTQETETARASFLAVGDIMLSRNVAGTIKKANDPLLPFLGMKEVFNAVDFAFGNLESPVSGSDYFNPSGSLVFNAPPAYTQGLKEFKFKALTLANNHALDQSEKGLFYTLDFLDSLNIKHTGAGRTLTQAWQPAIVEQNGIKICFIGTSYASVNDSGKTSNDYVARIEDLENLKLSIQNSQQLCDFTVMAMHAGVEYQTNPNQSQKDFAHASIDAGADMVIGSHPHWVQTIERYCPNSATQLGSPSPDGERGRGVRADDEPLACSNPKYIFYSLGNFIFDQEWSRETKEGLTLRIEVSKIKNQNELQGTKIPAKLESVELIPVIIENYSTPRIANEGEAKRILDRMNQTETVLR